MKHSLLLRVILFGFTVSYASSVWSIANSQKIIIEMNSDNAYTLISNKGVKMQNVPADYQAKVNQLLNRNVPISDVEFTPDGGWTILTASSHHTQNIGGDYSKVLNQVQSSGKKVNAVAFYPLGWTEKHGFVIVYDKGYKANNVPSTLTSKLDEFLAQGAELKSVEFTPAGGWSIISDISTWGNMKENPSVKVSYLDYISSLFIGNHNVFASAFNPDNYTKDMGWVVVEDDKYTGQSIPEGVRKALEGIGLQYKASDLPKSEEADKSF